MILFKDVSLIRSHLLLLLVELLDHSELTVQFLMPSANFILLLFGLATGSKNATTDTALKIKS